ncbi:MAG: hypothetical protein LBN25_00930 [Christensenellaceae bacterium]|jgi:hypothetical protein|nr:hypothetical protein [Christensenellaceae bacterium]
MKRFLFTFIIICFSAALVLTGCKNTENDTPPDEEETILPLPSIELPDDLPSYSLGFTWSGYDGFNPYYPTVILFNGLSESVAAEGFSFPAEAYYYDSATNIGTVEPASKLLTSAAARNFGEMWNSKTVNLGIFHYEAFSVDASHGQLTDKIFNADAMTYVNKDGVTVSENLPSFTLTDAFVYAWSKVIEKEPIRELVENRPFELRFIGSGAGATLALAAADKVNYYASKGVIPEISTVNRITLTNPYFPADEKTVTDIYGNTSNSVLEFAYNTANRLSAKTTAFELVESDMEFFKNRYGTAYAPYIEVPAQTLDGEPTYELDLTEGDGKLYKALTDLTAYVKIKETFSALYPENYKALDRVSRDWYLYTVNGSENTTSTQITGYGGTSAILDGLSFGTSAYAYSTGRFAPTAWATTPYVAALKGVCFETLTARLNTITSKYDIVEEYVANYFKADINLGRVEYISGITVGGFVFQDDAKNKRLNYLPSARHEGVEVRIIDGEDRVTVIDTVYTDSRGYWSYTFAGSATESINYLIKVVIPRYYDGETSASSADYNEYTSNMMTLFDSDGLYSYTVPTGSTEYSMLILRNCAVLKR